MMPRRRMILVLLLAGSVLLSLQSLTWMPDSDRSDAVPALVRSVARASGATIPQARSVPGAAGDASGNAGHSDGSWQLRGRPESARSPHDLFAAYSWQPPPPPAPAVAAVPPEAPEPPFVYVGRIEVEGRSIFLLVQGERTLRVGMGESVGDFKLMSSGPQGLVFLHQPTGLTRVLVAPGVPVASN
jgi:hypothetical protein